MVAPSERDANLSDEAVVRSRHDLGRYAKIFTALFAVFGLWWFLAGPPSGDPGGRVMSQLVPAALSLPGAGSATLPWGGRVSSQLPYIAEHEPQRAYCVRTAPATGWTMVELRAQYFSSYGVMYEIERMMHKLQPLGWTSTIPVPGSSLYQSLWLWTSNTWTKTLTNGTVAHVHLWYDRKLNAYEFDATALPAKTYYRHC